MGIKSKNKRLAKERSIKDEANNSKSFYKTLNWIVYSSISLIICSIILYIDTVISLKTIWITALICGICTSFFLLSKWTKEKQPYWQTIVTGLLLGGSISTFLIIAPNYFIKDKNKLTLNVDIVKSGNKTQRRSNCKTPFAHVIIDEVEKELTFPCSYESTIKNYKTVQLTLYNGLWGFKIINDKNLK